MSGDDDGKRNPTEEAWFAQGAPVPDDFVDPELAAVDSGAEWGQRAVLVMVAAFAVFLAVQYVAELRYWMSDRTPMELNEGADESLWIGPRYVGEDGRLQIPSNRFAHVEGIPQRKSISADREYFNLIGSSLYVERVVEDDRPRILRGQPMSVPRGQESIRPLYDGAGRVVAFEDLPRRYQGLIQFYSDSYQVEFCGFEPSAELRSHQVRLERQAELALTESLGRAPTEEEVLERAGASVRCQHGYLLLDGQSPQSFNYVPLMYAVFVVSVLGSAFFLLRSRRDARK